MFFFVGQISFLRVLFKLFQESVEPKNNDILQSFFFTLCLLRCEIAIPVSLCSLPCESGKVINVITPTIVIVSFFFVSIYEIELYWLFFLFSWFELI